MFSAQQILQPSILNKRAGLSFPQTDSEPFIQTLLQQSDEGGAISSLSSAQSLLSQLWENFVYRLPGLALGLVIMAAFILLAPHIAKVLVKPLTRTTTSPLLRSVIQRSVSLVLILLGIYLF
ncbi:MAG: mechanosensitive ion channel protein MscS, partial [Pseudomonadota bacterium]|nr:mechanosensitive ion channel protein MscS [Pseudomonadota bacterium]